MFQSLSPKFNFCGLDISDKSIKLAKIKEKKGNLLLSSYSHRELETGLVEKGKVKDEDLLASEIRNLLKNIKGKSLTNKYVATSLPEEKAFFQIIEIPKVKNERIKSAIEYQAEDYIPLAIEDVYLDYEIITNKKNSLEVLLAAIPKKVINPQISAIKKANLFPVVGETESMSIVRTFTRRKEEESPLLLIDIGETKMILIILSKRTIIFTSYILISSEDFTKKIAEENNISFQQAEQIKINYGINSKRRPDIKKSLNPLLEKTVGEVKKHLAYYNSCGFKPQDDKEQIKKIILCGGGSNLSGLTEFLANRLDLPVEKGNPFINVSNKAQNLFEENMLGYGVALGLALRNFEEDKIS